MIFGEKSHHAKATLPGTLKNIFLFRNFDVQ